ncbi:MAG: FlgD immunoglobulin-like domain containing protein [Candidatus Krumholzibacteriia bacterium]
MLARARQFADWVLEHRTPPDDLWGNLPYSTQTEGVMGGGWDGPAIMSDKPAMFALRLLRLHDITGEPRYLQGALEIADVLASNQLQGGPEDAGRWPFRVVPATGEVTQDYTSHLQPAVRLFDALAERTGDAAHAAVRDAAWAWLLQNPCNPASASHQRWEAFYEDQSPEMQTGLRDHYSAHEMIVELVRRRPAGWPELAVTILDTTDVRYLAAGAGSLYAPYEPVTLEWEGWPEATYAATLQYARTSLLLHRALEGHPLQRETWRERALAMVSVATHGQNDRDGAADGRMFTTVRDLLHPFNIDSWYEQNFNTVKYVLEIMALVPELAPAGETHLLAADRALTAIEYGTGGWAVSYATAGGSGEELLKLAGAPAVVRAGGAPLSALPSPGTPGPGWWFDAAGQLLRVRHDASPVEIRLAATDAGPEDVRSADFALMVAGGGETVRIAFSLPRTMAIGLTVHDLRGRRVQSLLSGAALAAGRHEVRWDGTDGSGRQVAAGVYLLRLSAAGGAVTGRVVLVR